MQTWHGTPLKKLARHAPNRYLSASYRSLMERESQMWDILSSRKTVSPRMSCLTRLATAATLTLGYPRNDALAAPGRASRAERVRRELGVTPEKIVVLYAPTWRDNAKDGSARHALVNHLDFAGALKSPGAQIMCS